MGKYAWISAGLSILIIALLAAHYHMASVFGNKDLLNMAFGLPIGLVMAVDIDIVIHKIRPHESQE